MGHNARPPVTSNVENAGGLQSTAPPKSQPWSIYCKLSATPDLESSVTSHKVFHY